MEPLQIDKAAKACLSLPDTHDNATIEKSQHPGVFNMIFADTHAESVQTKVLLDTNVVYRSRWNHDHLP